MILRADPLMREIVHPEVLRFIQYCRNRAAYHAKRGAHRPVSAKTEQLLTWLAERGTATTAEICAEFGLNNKSFASLRARHKGRIVEAGRLREGKGNIRLWRVASP